MQTTQNNLSINSLNAPKSLASSSAGAAKSPHKPSAITVLTASQANVRSELTNTAMPKFTFTAAGNGTSELTAAATLFQTVVNGQQEMTLESVRTAAQFNVNYCQLQINNTKLQSKLQQYEAVEEQKAKKKIREFRIIGAVFKLVFAAINIGTMVFAPEAVPEEEMEEHAAEKAFKTEAEKPLKEVVKKEAENAAEQAAKNQAENSITKDALKTLVDKTGEKAGQDEVLSNAANATVTQETEAVAKKEASADAEKSIEKTVVKKMAKKYNKARLVASGINLVQGGCSLTSALNNNEADNGPLSKAFQILHNILSVATDAYSLTKLCSDGKFIQAVMPVIGSLNAGIKLTGDIDSIATNGKGKLSELSQGLGGLVKYLDPDASKGLVAALDILGEVGQLWGTISTAKYATKALATGSTSKLTKLMNSAYSNLAKVELYLLPGQISNMLTQEGISTTNTKEQVVQTNDASKSQNVGSISNNLEQLVGNNGETAKQSLEELNQQLQQLVQGLFEVFNSNISQYAVS